jgi:ubiquinone/menaquinone biosynthesis C-methylase UbiE
MNAIKDRIIECEGINEKDMVQQFDRQDKTQFYLRLPLLLKLINVGINCGNILEAGSGPGILGLNLLKFSRTNTTRLFGVDISPGMTVKAKSNANLYNLTKSASFITTDLQRLPFKDKFFDSIISNGSLHHWPNPQAVFLELERVLKPDGKIFISDLRRDAGLFPQRVLKTVLTRWQGKQFDNSFQASYTIDEGKKILKQCGLKGWSIAKTLLEFEIRGTLYKLFT